jgi:hypothetical protein
VNQGVGAVGSPPRPHLRGGKCVPRLLCGELCETQALLQTAVNQVQVLPVECSRYAYRPWVLQLEVADWVSFGRLQLWRLRQQPPSRCKPDVKKKRS